MEVRNSLYISLFSTICVSFNGKELVDLYNYVVYGLHQSILEGDSELVYKALIFYSSPQSNIDHIIKDTLSIASSLRTYSFSHTRKQGNSIAHGLARRAMSSFPLLVCVNNIK